MRDPLFSIVVADDEAELRSAVCQMIHWEELGFRLVGSAGNGLDALQLVEQLQPDLLLTDIQMPFITGTALARQVRELQPLIQVAFLSGYDDFEYARSAIESDVIAYLLKPISMAELTDALREIHDKMTDRFDALRPSDHADSLPLAVASLLLDSFNEQFDEKELRRTLLECGMVFTEPYEMTVLATQAGKLDQGAAQTVDKVLRKYYRSCSVVSGGRVLSLLVSEDGFSRLGPALDELYYVVKRLLTEPCIIGVSRGFSRLQRCAIACREAVDAARLADGPGVVHIGHLQAAAEDQMQREWRNASQFDRLFFSGSRREMEDYLGAVLGESSGEMEAMQVLVTVQSVLRSALGEELSLLLRRFGLSDPLSAGLDAESLRRSIIELCLAGQNELKERNRGGMSLLVERTLRIIDQRYMEEGLSLGSVSEELHVSPNYLSANMKKHAGDTFINLLIKKRMETARTMLRSSAMKIGEVAGRCGYADQHYFSYCFKKYFGVSPAKMRRGDSDE